jgi:hypothetical protein
MVPETQRGGSAGGRPVDRLNPSAAKGIVPTAPFGVGAHTNIGGLTPRPSTPSQILAARLLPGEKEPASPISSKPSAPVNLRKADPSQMACRCRFVSGRSAGPFVQAGEMRPGTSATRPKNV